MNETRKKFSKLLILSMMGFGLAGNFAPSAVFADNPNEHSAHHSLTGGWDKAFIGNSGRHWTRYSQRYSIAPLYAAIKLDGYLREADTGNYQTAYKKASRAVDEQHGHIHSGGQAN